MRARSHLVVLLPALSLVLLLVAAQLPRDASAQTPSRKNFRPDVRRALASRTAAARTRPTRPGAYAPQRKKPNAPLRSSALASKSETRRRGPARPAPAVRAAGRLT